jgi:hypothetical protein
MVSAARSLAAAVVLAYGALFPGVQPARAAPEDKGEEPDTEWEVWCDFNNNVFPSFNIATATLQTPAEEPNEDELVVLGDPGGGLGVLVRGAEGATVTVTLKKNKLLDESTFTGKIPKGAEECLITPKALYDYEALHRVRQPMPLNLVATLQVDGKDLGQKVLTVTVRSLNDCVFGRVLDVGEAEGEAEADAATPETFEWMFAAYVNENHPGVEKLLKQALEAEIVDSFDGYQSEDPEVVVQQVYAIWNVLQRQGVKYSNITTTHAEDQTLWSQHVRFLDEVMDGAQANCVDGTVLFASALRKIGISPYLAVVPGHMFLAFSLDGADEHLMGLETTMMGQGALKKVDKNKKLSDEMREKMKNEESWATFEAAADTGTQALEEAAPHFDDEDDPDYLLISVAEARKMGIMPIAHTRP